jgi:hypothetical protein
MSGQAMRHDSNACAAVLASPASSTAAHLIAVTSAACNIEWSSTTGTLIRKLMLITADNLPAHGHRPNEQVTTKRAAACSAVGC